MPLGLPVSEPKSVPVISNSSGCAKLFGGMEVIDIANFKEHWNEEKLMEINLLLCSQDYNAGTWEKEVKDWKNYKMYSIYKIE